MLDQEWISYADQLQDQRWKDKRQEILQRDDYECRMCSCSGSEDNPLEVHHRFYYCNSYAWQYNNNALITLCARCHTLVHLTISPLSYAYNHKRELVIMNFTPCLRCDGAGYFRQYRHIEHGICFRCRGERFEELIDKKGNLELDNYFNHEDKVFDVLQIQISPKEVINYYERGHRFRINPGSPEKDIEEAYNFLYKAATNGHMNAQHELARLIIRSRDRSKIQEAFRWFTYAAMKGNRHSMMYIAALLRTGLVSAQSDYYAQEWEKIACQNENDLALSKLLGIVTSIAYKSGVTDYYRKQLIDLANNGNQKALEMCKILAGPLKIDINRFG